MRKPIPKARWQAFFKKHLHPEYWIIMVKRRSWLKWTLASFFFLSTILPVCGFLIFYYYTGYIPFVGDLKDDYGQPLDFDKLARSDFKKASYVYAADGKTKIGFAGFYEIRDPVKINEVPLILKNAFIAAEDKRFYSRLQFGIDPIATFRAGIIYGLHHIGIKYGKKQGASGIPQQLARLLYADEVSDFRDRKQTFLRKIKEARTATQLVRRYPKDMILEGFLNLIWLGHGVYGVSEGSRRYLGKNIKTDGLNPQEAVILASLNKSPEVYCPIYHQPKEPNLENLSEEKRERLKNEYKTLIIKENVRIAHARERENWVLLKMLDNNYLASQQYEQSLSAETEMQLNIIHFTPLKNAEFGYANRFVKEILLTTGHEDDEINYFGGLKVTTTIDPTIQKIADEEFKKQLAELNSEIPDGEERLQGALVIINIKTGEIKALICGNNFEKSQYDRCTALRSPGSGFKGIVFAAAFEAGKTFYDKLCNSAFRMRGANGKTWSPKNFKEEHPVPGGCGRPLPEGMVMSINRETLDLARKIGMDIIIDTAHKLGINGHPNIVMDSDGNIWFRKPRQQLTGGLVPLLPTAIGASDVNLLEITNAYATIARNGIYLKPILIKEIRDYEGSLIQKFEQTQGRQTISIDSANKTLELMRAVTKIGTAKISMRNIEQQVACKTGTSNGPRDVQIYCATPELMLGIRFGYDSNKVISLPQYMKKVSGRADMLISGGWAVGPLGRRLIDRIYQLRSNVNFSEDIENGTIEVLNILSNK